MTYRNLSLIFAIFILHGCSAGKTQPGDSADTSPPSAAAADPSATSTTSTTSEEAPNIDGETDSPTPEIDRELTSFLASPGLDSRHYENFGKARSAKMTEAKEVNDTIKESIAETDDRDVRAHLAIQRARVFLAVACQMINIKPAPDADDAELAKTKAYATQASDLFFPGADESLRDAVGFDGERSPEAGQMLLSLRSMDDRKDYCNANQRLWRPHG